LVPGMARAKLCLANVDLRKRRFYLHFARQDKAKSEPLRDIAVFGKDLVERGDDFVRIALNAGHPLDHAAAVDRPDWPCVSAVVRASHDWNFGSSSARQAPNISGPISTNRWDKKHGKQPAVTQLDRSNDARHPACSSIAFFTLRPLAENPIRFRDRAENVIK
jgi:hypothetical protein